MPMSWTLYLLWLSTGVLCKTWLKLRNDLSGNDKKYIERMNISAFFQAGDICMDIYSKLPENRLIVIYLKWGQIQTLCNQCDTLCFFFLFAEFCPLAFYREGLTMWPRQRKHNPEQDSCLILLSTWYRLEISSLNKQFSSFFVQIYVSIYVQRAYSYWMLKQNTTHNLIRNISIVCLSFLNAFNH